MKELNFDDENLSEKLFICDKCDNSWISDNEIYKIKWNVLAIEDDCPDCGRYIIKYL